MNNILKIVNLEKKPIVYNLNIALKSGEIIGLLGPNGAGKTTSFYLIAGIINSTQGKIFLNNIDITEFPIHLRARQGISYLPQEASIFRTLSVQDNIMSILELKKNLTLDKKKEKLENLLNEFKIQHIRNQKGISLSGGERRRVEIARLLCSDPKFILLDEPFAGVDPVSIDDIKDIICYLKTKNIGIIITDHNVRETLKICDKAYIAHQGTILTSGSTDYILNHELVKKFYLGENFKL